MYLKVIIFHLYSKLHDMSDQCFHLPHIFVLWYFSLVLVVVKSFFVEEGMNINSKVKSIENAISNFLQEVIVTKDRDTTVDATDSLDEAVIVNTGHDPYYWSWSEGVVDTAEDELEEVKNTGPIVAAGEILQDDICAAKVRLKITLVPEQKIVPA